ncbi:MAG: 23S rRNA (pseudouridine(1915)-N(3))-methyltransferase RlmH [Mangrovibacterium sp.]|nr:23S rRNA (pseudouridine(1915)-N(3))-methyltransferase RlmH [Mangrovibacterium sp.]
MKIKLIVTGKTDKPYLHDGIDRYSRRITHYLPFEFQVIPDVKNTRNMSESVQKEKEGGSLLARLGPGDELILLDERGKTFTSLEFARFLEKKMFGGTKSLIFAIGGPYGFSERVDEAAALKISLSKMTFSHQMVRLVFTEQLYRALTILKGEPYHHA